MEFKLNCLCHFCWHLLYHRSRDRVPLDLSVRPRSAEEVKFRWRQYQSTEIKQNSREWSKCDVKCPCRSLRDSVISYLTVPLVSCQWAGSCSPFALSLLLASSVTLLIVILRLFNDALSTALHRIGKDEEETILVCSCGGAEENHREASVRIFGDRAEIGTGPTSW